MYEFLVCLFGFCNSPSIYKRFVEYILSSLCIQRKAFCYIDDIVIPCNDEEGIGRVKLVLELAIDNGLKIRKPEKVSFKKI